MITRSCDGSYWLKSGLLFPKMLARLSGGGVGVGVGVGVGLAACAATGELPVGPLVGAEHAAIKGSISSGTRVRRFKRGLGYTSSSPATRPNRYPVVSLVPCAARKLVLHCSCAGGRTRQPDAPRGIGVLRDGPDRSDAALCLRVDRGARQDRPAHNGGHAVSAAEPPAPRRPGEDRVARIDGRPATAVLRADGRGTTGADCF